MKTGAQELQHLSIKKQVAPKHFRHRTTTCREFTPGILHQAFAGF